MIDTNCKRKFRGFVKRATVLAYCPIRFVIKFKNCNLIEPCSVSIACPGCVYLSHSTSTQKAFYYLFRILIYNMPSTSIWCIKKHQWTGESLQNFCATKKKGRFGIWLSRLIKFRISLPDPKDINEGEVSLL